MNYYPATLRHMYTTANAVVIGDVVKSDETVYYELSGLVQSIADVKITNVIKGDLNADDVISIDETGERFEDHDDSLGGVPLLRQGMKVVLFLGNPGQMSNGGTGYGIVACYYGKMFIDENGMVYPPAYYSDEAAAMGLSDCQEPISLNSFIAQCKGETVVSS